MLSERRGTSDYATLILHTGAPRLGLRRPAPQPALRGTRRLDAALCFSPCAVPSLRSRTPFFPPDLIEAILPHAVPSIGY